MWKLPKLRGKALERVGMNVGVARRYAFTWWPRRLRFWPFAETDGDLRRRIDSVVTGRLLTKQMSAGILTMKGRGVDGSADEAVAVPHAGD